MHRYKLLYDSGRFAEARDAFTHFVEREKKAGPGFAMVGLCEAQLQRNREALAAMEQGLRLGLGPNRDFARVVLYRDATLNTLLGRPELAVKRLTLLLNRTAAEHPGADTGTLLGDADIMDALGLAALRIPRLPAGIPHGMSAMVRQAGRVQALIALQDPVAAAREFKPLLEAFGHEPGVHYMYGIFLAKEDPPSALAEFQKEIAVSPKDVDARAQAALECLRAGDHVQGRKYALEAVQLAPGHFAAHLALARIWLALDRVDRATEESQIAVRLAPDSTDAHFTLSRCYARANRPKDAERERAEFQRLQEIMDRSEP